MPVFPERNWRALGVEMVQASGAPKDQAEIVTDVLIGGSLRGIDSHGVRILPYFTERRRFGETKVLRETKSTALLDAANVWGPVSAVEGMKIAMKKAGETGVGICSITNGDWITNLFYYSEMALSADMIGSVFVRDNPICSPWAGTRPVTGTDPMSIAFPSGKSYPIVLDYATTAVAQGHVRTLVLEGRPIPEGWLIDRAGNPVKGHQLTLDKLDDFWDHGGSLLPFGTYKGYGLNIAVGILGGALNHSGTGTRGRGQGVLLSAIDVSAFVPVAEFKEEIDRLVTEIKSSPLRPGFDEILLPGEREYRTMSERRNVGLPIDEKSWELVVDAARKNGIDAMRLIRS